MKEYKKIIITVNGKPHEGIPFTNRETLREMSGIAGKYLYDFRHADGMMHIPATLEMNVFVNHFGYFLCDEPIPEMINPDFYHQLNEDEVIEVIEVSEENDSEDEDALA